ncbi:MULTISPECIES: hypothetical protein [Carboxydocella]|uniref:DUF5666 domain-containing protein n=2 Tax=Carboxydocella TaxID=178898 RepID=A0A1T4RYD0_9FIRM|nr:MULTISPECIES: hypothetical protein [Carboxydocella]AVX21393.1 hypothetical protein CFE_2250 [Carboxydocella thermautotrophica]AVX31882.1 hypothetical protein CTH_2343 [Carboxydocella thermautotrophica]SKA20856.1 hypothetical protein SAMN02745885_02330 [Carboxydocella sporoproducens DSM 16521]GAW28522.1 hypothetical protein ULO1_10920 [Carboxydocella sp. ULO1]GAW32389.1 hypothetical protein JDF658_21540 [Carboxydocella sp. JDF658]
MKRKTFIIWLVVMALAGLTGGAATRFYLTGQWPWQAAEQNITTDSTGTEQPAPNAQKNPPVVQDETTATPEKQPESNGVEKQVEGQIVTIDYRQKTLTLDQALDDNSEKVEGKLTLAPGAEIKIDGKKSVFNDIAIGDYAVLKINDRKEITSITIKR